MGNQYLSVSQLNEYVKMLMDSDRILGNVWLRGELSNFKNHYSTGHFYFSLKDEGALVRGVMFRSYASRVQFAPGDGMKVLVHGRVTAFVRDGQYQIYVDEMIPDGAGALHLAFEQLKAKLAAEGLFDEDRKRLLPPYPEKIGIVTSPTGVAIQDMLNILGRRFPSAEILLYPAAVQGVEASAQLVKGMRYFAEKQNVDVIIIGRGGGSAEDLWAFNDELLARTVAASPIPVISAVGHEVDFTICDFVADKRAPTPSAAAELAVPNAEDVKAYLVAALRKMNAVSLSRVTGARKNLEYLSSVGVLSSPRKLLEDKRMSLVYMSEKLSAVSEKKRQSAVSRLAELGGRLGAMSPLAVLSRGYSVVQNVRNISDVKKGDNVSVRVNGGTFKAEVTEVKKERKNGKNI